MSVECQVNVKSQSELDIGGRETCTCLVVGELKSLLETKTSFRFLILSSPSPKTPLVPKGLGGSDNKILQASLSCDSGNQLLSQFKHLFNQNFT